MHRFDDTAAETFELVVQFVRERLAVADVPLDHHSSPADLAERAPSLIGRGPRSVAEVWDQYTSVLAPSVLSTDSPRFLSFIPAAPTKLACLFDMVVSASSLNGTSWLEGAGAIHVENQVLRVIADAAGLPASAGGCFVSGGSAANLSALVVARDVARHRRGDRTRLRIAASRETHSSVANTAHMLDCDLLLVDTVNGRMSGAGLDAALALDPEPSTVVAVVATAGTTNAGIIDDLAGIGEVARDRGLWFHVDGAYGGAALFAPSVRRRFDGIELADSLVVDPHKWLFAPFDCCALLYADPSVARAAHTQHAEYLDVLHADEGHEEDWNPSDFAHHLSRRARGLPFWFSLATYGTGAYRDAVEQSLTVTREAARLIRESDHLELIMEPELSVVLFRRRGWTPAQYQQWSEEMLAAGTAFVVPTAWAGETVLRICVVNPRTTVDDVRLILDSLT